MRRKWWAQPGGRRRARTRTRQLVAEQLEDRTLLTAALPPSGLVSWWRAEDNPAGTVAKDFADGNDGTLMNGATFGAGEVGQAFSFDGVDDAIQVPSSSSLNLGTNDFTIESWVYSRSTGVRHVGVDNGNQAIVEKRTFAGGFELYKRTDGALDLYIQGQGDVVSGGQITNNVWHHVAVTRSSSTLKLYVDGVEVASGTSTLSLDSITSWAIGYNSPGNNNTPGSGNTEGFDGLIDEQAVYGRALSADEIHGIYQAGSDGKATIVVNTSSDADDPTDGVTSLREAINQSNATTGVRDVIGFNIPAQPLGEIAHYAAEKSANDSVGSNNGTLQGTAAYAPGLIGSGFSFDGNGYVKVPDSASLQLPDGPFSVSLWFNTSTLASDQILFSKGVSDANEEYTVSLGADGGIYWDYGGGQAFVFAPTSVAANQWYQLTVMYDPATTPRGSIYLNGVLQATTTTGTGPHIANSGSDLFIGTQNAGAPYYAGRTSFHGLIDEFGIYKRGLSASEVNNLYQTGKAQIAPAAVPRPVSWYRAEGNANDSAGSANGTLQGGATFAPGKIGRAFSFDGTDDGVVTSTTTTITNTLPLTVEAWVNPVLRTDGTDFPNNVFSNDVPGDFGNGFGVNVFPGGSQLKVEFNDGFRAVPGVSFNAGQWYHVAVVYTSGNYKAYVDGQLVDDFDFAPGALNSASLIRVGFHNDDDATYGTTRFFKGLIDEAAAFNVALTSVQIQAIYATGNVSPQISDEVSHYAAEKAANDSADGNNGTLQNGATFAPGVIGQAFSLNGTGAAVSVPDASNLQFTTQFTIDAWVNPSDLSDSPMIASKFGNASSSYELHLQADGAVRANISADGTAVDAFITGAGLVAKGTWSHIATTYNAGDWRMYVNGVYVAGKNSLVKSVFAGTDPLLIGRDSTTTHYFTGLIDEVQLANRALAESEIVSIYQSGQQYLSTAPVSLYRGEGNANDSADGNNGTLQHGAAFAPGIVGQAIDLTAPGSYVQIPDSPSLRLGAGEITLEAWIKADATGTYRTIMAKPDSVLPYEDYELRITANNTVEFLATDCGTAGGGCGGFVPVGSTSVVADGTFHHVAGVRRANGDQEIYVDGVLENTINRPVQNTNSSVPFTIGYPGQDFRGLVDEAQVFNSALSPSEIQAQVAAVLAAQSLVRTISLTSALPPINDSVIIDGYTQPGSSPNTLAVGNNAKLLIELDGTKGSGSAFTVNSPNNTFKGLVINRFPGAPFDAGYAFRLLSAGNTIQGSYLGINPAGDTAEPNRGGGISIQATRPSLNTPSGNNLIGGATFAARNVIGGGLQDFAININGIDDTGSIVGGDGNIVQGNYIGTNAAGSAMLGKAGINIFTKNNIIGGTTALARNVMFSFGGLGLNLSESNASGNTIQGNYIGINAAGDAALGSTTAGITLLRAPNNTIGGTAAGAGNVISGNSYGISASDSDNLTIQGNLIGTNAAGTLAVGNNGGIVLSGGNNSTIGGTVPGARNVISGSVTGHGIRLSTATTTAGNLIQGNYIGTDITGTAALPNTAYGIQVFGDTPTGTNIIGGTDPAARNVISGNGLDGINIQAGNIQVQGNFIGADVFGSAGLGNGGSGVNIFGDHNTIGGTAAGAGNVIAGNKTAGVFVTTGANNAILGNSIFSNTSVGIDLGFPGPTANDVTQPPDADAGANNLQNFPEISYATRDIGKLKVMYNVSSAPANSTYPIRVEFFLADSKSQGQTYLGFDTFLDTDFAAGGKTVTLATAAPIKVFDKIVATATDSLTAAAGGGPANTSEFSPSVMIASPWQNHGRLRWDVNDDTFISADDVVDVINYINAKGSGLLPDNAANQKLYYDVDGDNNVVAMDVIDIINYINAGRRLGGEAEAGSEPVAAVPSTGNNDVMALLAADVAAASVKRQRV